MPANERKYWPTVKKHVHILGEVRRVVHGTGKTSALYLYQDSVERGDEPTELPPARARAIIGACSGITCTICGQLVDWEEPPTEAYLRLMAHYPALAGS
jgi:hypothetical protein